MKIWRMVLLRSWPIVCLAMLVVFNGCESPTDDDNSGVSSYFDGHPYQSASRETPMPNILQISPVQVAINTIGQKVVFTASGGYGAFHWGVSDGSVGKINSQGADQAIYTCLAVGNNEVIVQDDEGHFAAARISPVTADTVTISPASVALSGGSLNASFSVSGGTAPYSWTSGNPGLGAVSYSSSSSYVASYTAVSGAYGQNVVTVIDAKGRTASATVTQSL